MALSFKSFTDVISTAADGILDVATGSIGDIASKAFLPWQAQIVKDVAIQSYQGQQAQATAQAEVAPEMAYLPSYSTVSESGGTIDIPASGTVYESGIGGALTTIGTGLIGGLLGTLGRSGVGGAIGGAVTGYTVGQMMAGGFRS